jgi:hypothetical protein
MPSRYHPAQRWSIAVHAMSCRPICHRQSNVPSMPSWLLFTSRCFTMHPLPTWSVLRQSWANTMRHRPPRVVHSQPSRQHSPDTMLGWRFSEPCRTNELQHMPRRHLLSRWLRRLSGVPAWPTQVSSRRRVVCLLRTGLLLGQRCRLLHEVPPRTQYDWNVFRGLWLLPSRSNVGTLAR